MLTDKQEKFVQELAKGKSQREAYRTAYPKSLKWKASAVDTQASILFNNSKVLERFREINNRLIKEAEDECIVDAKDVLKELARIGFADIKDYLSYRTGKTVVSKDENGEPIIDYAQIIEVMDSEKVDGRVIQEVKVNGKGEFQFKLYSKLDALDKIAKHLGMYVERKELTGKDGGPVEISVPWWDDYLKQKK